MAIRDLPPVMTISEAALFLRLDRQTVLDAAHAGDLPIIQLAPQLLIDTRALLAELGVRVEKALADEGVELEALR